MNNSFASNIREGVVMLYIKTRYSNITKFKMRSWKIRRNSDTKILNEKIIYLGDKSNKAITWKKKYIYIYVCIYKIDSTTISMFKLHPHGFSTWRKKHGRKRKRKRREKAIKFGREARLTARQGPRGASRIEVARP